MTALSFVKRGVSLTAYNFSYLFVFMGFIFVVKVMTHGVCPC